MQEKPVRPAPKKLFEEVDDLEDIRNPKKLQISGGNVNITQSPPSWFGNKIGVTDEVLPPWTPIVVDGDCARVVLREYRLGASGLPDAIVSRGLPLLAAPASLTLDGASATWQRRQLSTAPGKVVWEAEGRWPDVRATLRTTLEYDGMLRYDLTLTTASTGKARLRNLELTLPYRSERAQFGVSLVSTNFLPYHEVADMETGLAWFCEWAKGWQIGAAPCLETPQSGDRVNWKVRFIGVEGRDLSGSLTLTFGLQALPVRELDLSYQYDKRRIQGIPSFETATCKVADVADNALAYSGLDLGKMETGSLLFNCAPTLNDCPVVDLGGGRGTLKAMRSNATKYQMEFWHMATAGGAKPLARLGLLTRATTWFPLALTWQRVNDQTRLTWHSRQANGTSITATSVVPWSVWSAPATNGLRFGGVKTIAADEVALYDRALPVTDIATRWDRPLETEPGAILLDTLDRIRFSRGGYATRPLRAPHGLAGWAGARYGGPFVRTIEGHFGRALLLPAGENPSGLDWFRAHGGDLVFRTHETMGNLSSFYGIEFIADPIWKRGNQAIHDAGLGLVTYGGFGFNRTHDPDLAPYLMGLVREPLRGVKHNTALLTCAAAPGMADYYLHCWKQCVDYYGVRSIHADNTWHVWTCYNERHGCGWRDERGELQGRTPIFAARELAKRFRWLFHVYQKDGFIQLHAGARHVAPVGGFADLHMGGEKMGWTGKAEDLPTPETWNCYQYRVGVPVEILTKGPKHAFGPNWLYMYTLLSGMSVRMMGSHLDPAYWWTDLPAQKTQKPKLRLDKYQPYAVRGGVSQISQPGALWWMLQDEFDTRSATFYPFWRSTELVQLNNPQLRAALYVHTGCDALVIISNFGATPCRVSATLNLVKLGVAGRTLTAWDAYTDESYAVTDGQLQLELPAASYRIVRLETH